MSAGAKQLSNLKIKRISLCASPANEHAQVVFYKARKDDDGDADDNPTKGGDMKCKSCGAAMSKDASACPKCGEKVMKVNLDAIKDADTRKAVEEALSDAEAARALAKAESDKRVAAEARATEAEKKLAEKTADPEAEMLKSMPESVRKRIEKAESDAKAANDAVRKMSEEKREGEFIAKARGYANLSVDAKTFGPLLKRVADGTSTSADVDEINRVLVGANAVAKTALFSTRGSSERGVGKSTEAWAEIQAKAEEMRADVMKSGSKITLPDAMDRVIKANPELYTRHLREFSGKVAAAGAAGAVADQEE